MNFLIAGGAGSVGKYFHERCHAFRINLHSKGTADFSYYKQAPPYVTFFMSLKGRCLSQRWRGPRKEGLCGVYWDLRLWQ